MALMQGRHELANYERRLTGLAKQVTLTSTPEHQPYA